MHGTVHGTWGQGHDVGLDFVCQLESLILQVGEGELPYSSLGNVCAVADHTPPVRVAVELADSGLP